MRIYSVLNAITGSFFAAALDGTIPAIKVSTTLKAIISNACNGLSIAIFVMVASKLVIIKLIGMHSKYVFFDYRSTAFIKIV